MDVKAMARSKRSHTKHHQPRKPHRPKTQSMPSSSPSPSDDAKVVKEEGERKRSSLGNSLPSNWDRYDDPEEDEELFGSDSEWASGHVADAAKTDVVKPKSKGADFGFLISQAKSQTPADFSASFDDILPDFSQGLESMLSVRGETILSWTDGDNFLEDETSTSQEAPFFTLNLQTLAEELARIDLAQRLFIEEDILPPEMRVSPKKERNHHVPVSAYGKQSSEADDLASQKTSKVEKTTLSKEGHGLRSDIADSTDPTPSFGQEKQWDDFLADHESDSFRALDPKESFKAKPAAELENRSPRFEARAAEAELDMLLDSFNETKFFDSSNVDSNIQGAPTKQESPMPSFSRGAPSKNSAGTDLSRSSFSPNNIDDDIDDLLKETSNFTDHRAISGSMEVNHGFIDKPFSSSSNPSTKSKVMEDFDSWLDTI